MAGTLTARLATEADARRITEIYNQGIEDRVATFETDLRTVEAVRSWFSAPYPVVVVERGDEVIAWASTSQYRPRACYAGICEFSVYVDRAARGEGAGKVAMEALIEHAALAGYTKLLSRVFVENTASRRLLRGLGFREVGVYHRHGQLDGRWRDVVIVERLLDEPNSLWSSLTPGTRLTVIKTTFTGNESARYPATVVASDRPGWACLEALWTFADSDIDNVIFQRGGTLREYFSPASRFNVFQVFRRDGSFGGIYANVTAPTRLELDQHGGLVLVWEDHWLDVVKGANGRIKVLDEDEFEASGLGGAHPRLAAGIVAVKDELRAQIEAGTWDA